MKKRFNTIILISILLFAFFIRILKLSIIPVGITHDQLDYIINAKAIFLTGSDLTQTWNFFSLTGIKTAETVISELLPTILALFIGPFKFSLFSARLPFVLANICLIYVVYLISKKLINRNTALVTALFLAINPWAIHFSRSPFESLVALTFYLTGVYLILKLSSWKMLYAFPLFILGFFSYHALKIIFLPLLLVTLVYKFLQKKQDKKPFIALFSLGILVIVFFIVSLKFQAAASRIGEVSFLSPEIYQKAQESVYQERSLALPSQLNTLFSNKATYYLKDSIIKYLNAFSPSLLFLTGENSGIGAYTNWHHGLFYYIDFVFLVLGLLTLYHKHKKSGIFLFALALISPLPTAVSNNNLYTLRSALLFPILTVFIAYGILFFIQSAKNKLKPVLIVGLTLIYLLSFINFYHIYFIAYPVYGSEGFLLSKRILSSYLIRSKTKAKNIFISDTPIRPLFEQYLFYDNALNSKDAVRKVAKSINNNQFIPFENMHFSNNCLNKDIIYNKDNLVIQRSLKNCKQSGQLDTDEKIVINKIPLKPLSISSLEDAGQIYKIYNDTLCSKYKLNPYPRVYSYKDFEIETMDDETFCKTWISDLNDL
ncbi:hypothetical protein GYA49_05315 [Candidatus Beckwithbacteria bacterium]|nr:hypothetical protein [Candidatus Beckwithbacteria bacterium]